MSFINRELSWLEFNQRVLDEALRESLPLMERLKFLGIFSSNMDLCLTIMARIRDNPTMA